MLTSERRLFSFGVGKHGQLGHAAAKAKVRILACPRLAPQGQHLALQPMPRCACPRLAPEPEPEPDPDPYPNPDPDPDPDHDPSPNPDLYPHPFALTPTPTRPWP